MKRPGSNATYSGDGGVAAVDDADAAADDDAVNAATFCSNLVTRATARLQLCSLISFNACFYGFLDAHRVVSPTLPAGC